MPIAALLTAAAVLSDAALSAAFRLDCQPWAVGRGMPEVPGASDAFAAAAVLDVVSLAPAEVGAVAPESAV